MKEEMRTKLMPLYEEMLSKFEDRSNLTTFCARWEKHYPQEKGKGLLFVGRVVNGGVAKADADIETLFSDDKDDRILQPSSPIGWVEYFMNHKQEDYNINHSAFWRVIKDICQRVYKGDAQWYSQIAWTNLYKVSPFKEGNPTVEQEKIQLPYCKEILKAEIEVLQPQFIIFLTSGREKEFIWDIFGPIGHSIESTQWGNNGQYTTKLYKVNDMYIITSYHPQGKPDNAHIDAISKMIKDKLLD